MAKARRRTELDLDTETAGKLTKAMADFEIDDLRVSVEGREILKGVSLAVNKGEVHAVMGPNGSGKSTLSYTLMGHPNYKVTGSRLLQGQGHPDHAARGTGQARDVPRAAVPGGGARHHDVELPAHRHQCQAGLRRQGQVEGDQRQGIPPAVGR